MSSPAAWRSLARRGDHYIILGTPYLLLRRVKNIAPSYYKIDWVAFSPLNTNDAVRMVFSTLSEADDYWWRHTHPEAA